MVGKRLTLMFGRTSFQWSFSNLSLCREENIRSLQMKYVKRLSCTVIINRVTLSLHLKKGSSQIRFEAF